MVEFMTPPFIDGLKCEEDVRRVASALIVLQNACKVLSNEKLEAGDILGALEFEDRVAPSGAEVQTQLTAAIYEVSGYNVQKFIDEQAADGREYAAHTAEVLAEMFPEVEPR